MDQGRENTHITIKLTKKKSFILLIQLSIKIPNILNLNSEKFQISTTNIPAIKAEKS